MQQNSGCYCILSSAYDLIKNKTRGFRGYLPVYCTVHMRMRAGSAQAEIKLISSFLQKEPTISVETAQ